MLDLVTVLVALAIFFVGPHWLLACMRRADRDDAAGDQPGTLTWTLAAVLGSYLIGLAFLLLLITAVQQTALT
ncbi:MAG: hypothetical protein NZL87_06810 [Thermomicrobium sp.]|nr:hypothetical protein [Thermomicrobium sp.]MCS7246475.1 hypothetical protein [Thermomicrobium sp.]MDW7982755.1 hypothetical protein [Thermomicrobium sp.]